MYLDISKAGRGRFDLPLRFFLFKPVADYILKGVLRDALFYFIQREKTICYLRFLPLILMDRNKKNNVRASELARQERARNFRQSRFYRSCLEDLRIPVWLYNVACMHRIRERGLDMFDENGQLLVRNPMNLKRQQMSGDIFLIELIEYWLEQDEPYAYHFAGKAKALLDAYNQKFGE